jgi:2-polyprenyl-6-methoxyphenol hydroxylase-like FAD-dependent oxidoreductase
MERHDVLIAGAGPTGLVLALWLVRQGVNVCIVDKTAGPGTTSRAMAVHARTLELYRQLGLADALVAAGTPNPAINLWVKGKRAAHVSFGTAGADVSPYPFLLVYPQDRHERLLVERLEQAGVTVQRNTEMADFEDEGDHVLVRLRGPGGVERCCEARFLAGCDGARSTTRHRLGAGFEGGTYKHLFYVADVEVSGPAANGEIHLSLEEGDFAGLFSYGQGGRARLIGTVRDERAERPDTLTFADVGHQAMASLGLHVEAVNWFSTYHVHHRVADHFRYGRAFLLGDAAHIHSPAGGQGMNTGIGDAINLAWKLRAVLKGEAPDSLLDSYEIERIAFAKRLVATTDRIFSFVTAEGNVADFVRTHIAPIFVGVAFDIGAAREFMFRMASQTLINYHDSPLSEGSAGRVRGGDRLPWVLVNGRDNYATLERIGWQVHVYGAASEALAAWCRLEGVGLHVFAWNGACEKAGLARDAAYLLRPDTYVAFADASAQPAALERYLDERRLVMPT